MRHIGSQLSNPNHQFISMKSFYCRTHTNVSPFDESEQKLIEFDLKNAGWDEMEIFRYIHPETCKKQCERCMNEMLDNRAKTQRLVDKLKNKSV